MNKKYGSVSEMLADASVDESVKAETTSRMVSRRVIKRLLALRVAQGKSQGQIAEAMKCSQSRISKLENGLDDDIRLRDLRDYLHALGHDLSLFVFKKQWQSAQQIKFCATMIHDCLKKLVALVDDDEVIERGVFNQHIELLVNMVNTVVESAMKLPSFPQMMPGIIEANGSDEELESGMMQNAECDATV